MRILAAAAVFLVVLVVTLNRDPKHSVSKPAAKASVPAVFKKEAIKAPTITVKKMEVPMDWNSMPLGGYPPVVYKFEGIATCAGAPCPGAQVTVRVSAGKQSQTQAGMTGADGAYSIPVSVSAALYAPVEWSIEAHSQDYQPVELTGRRITTEEDKKDGRVTLEGALALL